jgi:DNA-binding LacI/PurR family transcriptional regulator
MIFLFGTPLPSRLEQRLRRRAVAGAQVVLLDAAPEHAEWATVVNIDGAAGVRAAVELLRRAGHERIALASWDVCQEDEGTPWWIVEREDAYREAMRSAGLDAVRWRVPFAAVFEHHGTPVERLGPEGAAALADARRRPTAVVCVNDIVARAVAEAWESSDATAGKLPALTGFDDDVWTVGFGLTTFQRPFRQLAMLIAEMAVQSGAPGQFRCRGLLAAEPVLVERSSTPPPGA